MAHLKPFQLLEINIISAQDLKPVSKNMRTYATAWVHPKRKLSTMVDTQGGNNPTWNDKFVFRVDEEFLRRDTSAVMIEIHAVHWFRDTLVGTVRVLVGNLVPPSTRPTHHHHPLGMRFLAVQVRRPTGRPQGILNLGVAVLDSSMRSMPLYTQLCSSAVGYRDLMDEDKPQHHHQGSNGNHTGTNPPPTVRPILRRSRSERSERVTFNDDLSTANSSIVGVKAAPGKAGSLLTAGSESTVAPKGKKSKKGKASSVISGAELREKPKEKGKKGKASSVIGSIISRDSRVKNVKNEKPSSNPPKEKEPTEKINDPIEDSNKEISDTKSNQGFEIGKLISKFNGLEENKNSGFGIGAKVKDVGKPVPKFKFGGPKGSSIVNGKYSYGGGTTRANSLLWSDSEVGPSPSEVAAVMASERYPIDDNQSSVLDGWSLDESVEGLRSKLERWRTELPPLYDRGFGGSSSFRSTSQHVQRHTADDGGGGSGLFSCFGNIYGYECQCVCGKPPDGRRSLSNRFQSPSASGRSF